MGTFAATSNARARPHRPDRFRRRGHPGSCDARRAASEVVWRAAPLISNGADRHRLIRVRVTHDWVACTIGSGDKSQSRHAFTHSPRRSSAFDGNSRLSTPPENIGGSQSAAGSAGRDPGSLLRRSTTPLPSGPARGQPRLSGSRAHLLTRRRLERGHIVHRACDVGALLHGQCDRGRGRTSGSCWESSYAGLSVPDHRGPWPGRAGGIPLAVMEELRTFFH